MGTIARAHASHCLSDNFFRFFFRNEPVRVYSAKYFLNSSAILNRSGEMLTGSKARTLTASPPGRGVP